MDTTSSLHSVSPRHPEVFIVDDDAAIRSSLTRLLKSAGLSVQTFDSAEALLQAPDLHTGSCILLDVRLPGIDGISLQDKLAERGCHVPIIFLTAFACTSMVVRAMKHGASYFLEKPIDGDELLSKVREAIRECEVTRQEDALVRSANELMEQLTARERSVLEQVVLGRLNKQIAAELGISEKTVKVHRAHGLQKLGVRGVADLVRLFEKYELSSSSHSLN